jgi:hypothetical protein
MKLGFICEFTKHPQKLDFSFEVIAKNDIKMVATLCNITAALHRREIIQPFFEELLDDMNSFDDSRQRIII